MLTSGILLLTAFSEPVWAFPLRIGEDCFYGEGMPDGQGVSTWMGYAVDFTPPYAPYTVDSISIYIDQLWWSGDSPRMWIAVLDASGIMRQFAEINWSELEDHRGWVLIPLTTRTYNGSFTVIVNSGIGLPPAAGVTERPIFKLGIDRTTPDIHSRLYTSDKSPPIPPFNDLSRNGDLAAQAQTNNSKLAAVTTVYPELAGANWMIRAHAPGLQMENTYIVINQEDLDRYLAVRNGTYVRPEWTMPPMDILGPRNTVHCPTSLAGVTFYYYEGDRARKFIFPHDGPWINPDLASALGAMCSEMASDGLVGIEHIGIFNDRNIAGTNTRSSHAFGLGIDISGFEYADGRTYFVEDHDNPAVRAQLEYIRDTYLKKYFPTVLDWNYQRHDNHFHVNLPYTP